MIHLKRTRAAPFLVTLVDAVVLSVANRVGSNALTIIAPGGWKVPVFKDVNFKFFNEQVIRTHEVLVQIIHPN